MSERRPEIPKDICPKCFHNRSDHATDCTYETELKKGKKAEGITPEYEEGVSSGKITYDKQIKDINRILKMIMDPEDIKMAEVLDREAKKNEDRLEYEDDIKEIRNKVDYCQENIKKFNQLNNKIANNTELKKYLELIIANLFKLKESYYSILINNKDNKDLIQETDKKSSDLKNLVDNFINKFKL